MAVNHAGHVLRSIQHQASLGHFTIFEFLQVSNISCPREISRLFWPSGLSGRNFHAFCPRVCLLRAWVPSFGWSETMQIAGVLPMTRLGWTCIFSTSATGWPHVESIRCIRFGLKVNSRCSGLTFFLHTQKEMGRHYMHKNQVSDC